MNSKYTNICLPLLFMSTFTLFLGWVPIGDMAPKLLLVMATLLVNPKAFATRSFFFVFMFLIYTSITESLAGLKVDVAVWLSHSFYIVIPIIVSNGVLYSGSQNSSNKVAKYSIFVSFVSMFFSIIALIKDPMAIRLLSAANSMGQEALMYDYWRQGVSDYSMTAMMMFMPASLLFLRSYVPYKSRRYKFLLLGAIFSFTFIIMSIVSTAIIFCILVTIAVRYKKFFEKKIAKVLMIIGIGIIVSAPALISSITGLAGENDTLEKVGQVGDAMAGEDMGKTSDTAIRFAKVLLTIESISKNPIFGNPRASYGEHNYFLDQTAKYGLFGMFLFFMAIKLQIKRIRKLMVDDQWKIFKIFLVFFILFGFIKNMSGIEFWNYLLVYYPCILLYSNSISKTKIQHENSI